MKSSLINSIGEVVTDYGARVMKVFKKGLLGRSLFDFYGDIKADALRTNESSAAPGTPADGKGGVIYTKSADGKLYYKSNEVSEVEISANGGHTDEDIQDLVGGMVSGNTESGITVTYQDGDGTIDFTVGTLNQDTTGNAATATALETARAINGVDFNGTAPITVTAAGSTLSDTVPLSKGGTGATTASAARSALGVDAAGTDNSTNVTLAGTPDYITISGQEITRNAIDLTADVTGTLPVGNGGTGVVSLTADGVLTGNGTSGIIAESALTYTSADEELVIGNPDSGVSKVSRRHSSGTNSAGGNLILTAGAATGNAAGGSIEFHSSVAGSSGSTVQSTAEVATIDKDGNLSIDGDLTVKGNDIKDDDGTTCITFDSSGNTTVANTLNASVTGNVTGNTSGSSGSCTGNAATATALTSGNKTISGDLTVTDSTPSIKITTSDSSITTGQTLGSILFSNTSDSEIDSAQILAVATENFDDDPSSGTKFEFNLIPKSTSDTTFTNVLTLDADDGASFNTNITVSGDLSIGNDAEITSTGHMTFRIDSDADELSQSFFWRDNASDLVASLDEGGLFSIFGTDLGNPKILLSQSGPTATYGPPLIEFLRNSVTSDNADIGRFDFKARNSSGSEKTYAQILGLTEESGAGTEGGKIRFKIASHDAELVDGLIIEDGDAEDEIDVTIANGSSSLTTVAGNLNVTTNIELGHASDTTIARTAAGTASIEGKEIVTINKQKNIHSYAYHYSGTSAHFIPMSGATTSDSTSLSSGSYHLMQVMPFDGRVVRIAVFNQTTTSRDDLFEMYIDGDDSDPSGDQRGTDLTFTSTQKGNGDCATDWTFSKGEAIAIRRTPSVAVNGTTVTVVFEFDMTT